MDIQVYEYLFIAATAAELLLYALPFLWHRAAVRKYGAGVILVTLSFASGGILISRPNVFTGILLISSLYRIVNLLRLVENRMNPHYLRSATIRTGLVLMALQLGTYIFLPMLDSLNLTLNTWLYAVAAMQLTVACIFYASTVRRIRHTAFQRQEVNISASDLPTVTVSIPARNETDELDACLHALIASDYPKLEILVLDDCSQTRKTPEIIRSFAHSGVRFVKGDQPHENWLAKNQAYEKLANEASGDIMLFCGVDIRLKPDSVRKLVSELMVRKKRMVSIVPFREGQHDKPQHTLAQTARYYWEMAPPRRLFNRPPVLSSCWMIYKTDLLKLGSFKAVNRMVIPEAYFARQATRTDSYSFLRAGKELGITSTKSHEAQRQTAIRTRYPQLHRRPENVFILTLISIVCFLAPFIFAALGAIGLLPFPVTLLAVLAVILLSASNFKIAFSTGINSYFFAYISFVPMVITDIILMHVSMVKYEFSEVLWKGRNVCVPVMHVIPSLPPMQPQEESISS